MIKIFLIKLIDFYQNFISKLLPYECKYYPSCSEYFKLALMKKSLPLAILLGIYRILRCNPLSKGGIDFLR